jgi:sugar O-acyltransferase (sialic acid O-acetyltransferase NeuD family)
MDKILLFGGGGHGKSCVDVIESSGEFEISGIVDPSIKKLDLPYKLINLEEPYEFLRETIDNAIVSVGQIKHADVRKKIYSKLKEYKFHLPVIQSQYAYKSKYSEVDEGTILMHFSLVNSYSTIGKNCIINSKSLIEHDAVVGDHSHIATGAILNGGVKVGDETFIGSNTVIAPGKSIGNRCVINAGLFINEDIPDGKTVNYKS